MLHFFPIKFRFLIHVWNALCVIPVCLYSYIAGDGTSLMFVWMANNDWVELDLCHACTDTSFILLLVKCFLHLCYFVCAQNVFLTSEM